MVSGTGPAHAGHSWLAAVVPVDAVRFRVDDAALAATLADAGAELTDAAPDVEVVRGTHVRGDGSLAVVDLGTSPNDRNRRLARVGERLAIAGRVRLAVPTARARLRRAGYRVERPAYWDIGQRLRLDGAPSTPPLRLVERLARRALVVGWKIAPAQTLLDAVATEAGRATGATFAEATPGVREGMLIVPADDAILRVAVGPARAEAATEREVLEALHAARPDPVVAERVPWPVAHGRTGLADWLVERRLRGEHVAPGLDGPLLSGCVDFLVGLHAARRARPEQWSPVPDAEIAARFVPPAAGVALVEIARSISDEVAVVPCGFAHGDFWSGNLLVETGRLTGVVDWDAAAAARPALLDLIHLRLVDAARPTALSWGAAVVERLLPWGRSGGDDVSAEYCRRIGFEPTAEQLRALAIAYWLHRVAYQLGHYADRSSRWIAGNVELVLQNLRA
jgi:hypothetical protein